MGLSPKGVPNVSDITGMHGLHEHAGRNPNPITPKEKGLRVRLSGCEPMRITVRRHPVPGHPEHDYDGTDFKPNELCEKFLGLKPRPTIEKLEYALYPLGYNPRKHKGYVKGDYIGDNRFKLVRNRKGYNAGREKEALKMKGMDAGSNRLKDKY